MKCTHEESKEDRKWKSACERVRDSGTCLVWFGHDNVTAAVNVVAVNIKCRVLRKKEGLYLEKHNLNKLFVYT